MGNDERSKNWGGARQGAGRPAKQPGKRRMALSATVSDRHWAAVHVYAQHQGVGISEALDGLIGMALAHEPYAGFFEAWNATHTLEETLEHLAQGRERVVPKAPQPES
jgi:hypothetical protein